MNEHHVLPILSPIVDHANTHTAHDRDMEEMYPAIFPLNEDDRAGWVVVITITFFIYTFGAVTTKLSIRYKAAGWRPNDTVLALGLLILFVQSICVVSSCKNGLGKHQEKVTSEGLEIFDRVYLPISFRPHLSL